MLQRLLFFVFGFLFLSSGSLWASTSTVVHPIVQELNEGRADAALQHLDAVLAGNPGDARALNLRCRVYYEEEQWDRAISDCEAAVRADGGNSDYHLWLGRAYGQKASRVSLMKAYTLARKVGAEFQRAVQLDPRNVQALEALGEFDVSAPALVGGGLARAQNVAQQLQGVDAGAALTLEARIAESRHDYATAENDYKAAIARSRNPAAAWMTLAGFYGRRGRYDQMEAAARRGASIDPGNGPALVDGADALARARRDPQTAIQWLREYLQSHQLSEDAPAFAVHVRLAALLQNQGDAAGAQQQLAEAHALASGYRIPMSIASATAGR